MKDLKEAENHLNELIRKFEPGVIECNEGITVNDVIKGLIGFLITFIILIIIRFITW